MDFSRLLSAKPLIAEGYRRDFGAFCRAAWPHVHRGKKLSWTWCHDLICEHLVAVWKGQTKRLIVNCPPRFAKSTLVTILFPIWVWLQDPTLAFLACSYEIDLSTNHSMDRRRLMETAWFKDLFADRFQLATDRAQAGEFGNTAGGTMLAASVNSKAMGRGGDFILLDDILSSDQAYSDALRNEVNEWLQFMLPQRLNNPASSAIILVMQRLHQDDPTGFLLAREPGEWTHLKLSLLAEEDETWTFPITGRVVVRKKAECLDPRRFTPKVVRDRQKSRLVWSGQFQQEPAPLEGNIIRTADLRFFGGKDPRTNERDPDVPQKFDEKILSIDCSFKDTKTSDFVAILTIGISGSRRYVLNIVNAHLDLDGTENEIRRQHALFGPINAVLVEDKANGSAVVGHLKEHLSGVIAVNPEGGKLGRLIAASPEFQAHDWFLDRNAAWCDAFVEQLTMFPNARHDDMVDACTQAAIWLQGNNHTLGLVLLMKAYITGEKKMPRPWNPVAIPQPAPLTRPDVTPANKNAPKCPKCGETVLQVIAGGQLRCQQCGTQHWPTGSNPHYVAPMTRKEALRRSG